MGYLRLASVVVLVTVLSVKGAAAQSPVPARTSRWLELETATITSRYRYIENSAGQVLSNQNQYQDVLRARFKLDGRGRFSATTGLATGNGFISSWNNTGWGTGDAVTNHYLKQLFAGAMPARGIELQYGGLYLARGEATEITTYDNDGYIVGQRLNLKRPRQLFFDEVSITYGYLGDLNRPNLNKRFHRLQRSNYHEWLVTKNFGRRTAFSAAYAFLNGVELLRQAVRVRVPEARIIDQVRFEDYERTDVRPDYGFAITAEKTLYKRFTLGGGYADIDRHYGGINGDRFMSGRRLYASAAVVLRPEFSILAFVTRAVANRDPIVNATRVDVLFSYNLMASLRRAGLF